MFSMQVTALLETCVKHREYGVKTPVKRTIILKQVENPQFKVSCRVL